MKEGSRFIGLFCWCLVVDNALPCLLVASNSCVSAPVFKRKALTQFDPQNNKPKYICQEQGSLCGHSLEDFE